MEEYGVFNDGEAESCATHASAATLVDAIETLEDAGQMFWWDAHPVVAEAEHPAVFLLLSANLNCSALTGIVDGIVDEVAEDAVDKRVIALDDDALGQVVLELHVAFLNCDGRFLYDIAHNLRYVGSLHSKPVRGIVHSV